MHRFLDTRCLILVAVLGCACGKKASAPATQAADDAATTPDKAPVKQGCDLAAIGLGAAKRVPMYPLPGGCTPKDAAERVIIDSEVAFAEHFACNQVVSSAVDYPKYQLVVQHRQLSPAQVGGEVVDDGTTVTYVSHVRSPCPDDPRPMPMPLTVSFVLPAGAQRTFAEASCTVPSPPCK